LLECAGVDMLDQPAFRVVRRLSSPEQSEHIRNPNLLTLWFCVVP
jgi:hypothetical protein